MSKVKKLDGDVFDEFTQELCNLSTPAFRDELTRILSEMAKRRYEAQWRAMGLEPPQRFHADEASDTMKRSDKS